MLQKMTSDKEALAVLLASGKPLSDMSEAELRLLRTVKGERSFFGFFAMLNGWRKIIIGSAGSKWKRNE